MSLLDFESVSKGSSTEDISNFIFYIKSVMQQDNVSVEEMVDYFSRKNRNMDFGVDQLKTDIKLSSLKYGLGRIWEFNRRNISHKEIEKSLRALDRVENLI